MDSRDLQQQISESVARRGYRDGWTAAQFLARQVCKAAEELGEMAHCIGRTRDSFWVDFLGEPLDNPFWKRWGWQGMLMQSAKAARTAFDGSRIWEDATVNDLDRLRSEVADIQVVLACLAETISEIDGEPFDLLQAAASKAQADEARGRRGEN